MRAVWTIAKNTYREIIRDKILYGIVVFALLLVGMSLALGQLSFAEQARISANFGFTGIQLSAAILAIFVGSSLVAKEIEKQTILTLLARPITRSQFLMGKFVGLSMIIISVMIGLALVLAMVVSFLNFPVNSIFVISLFGILLEALILLSLSLFFGSFSRPMMTVTYAVAFFLIGHWVGTLRFFTAKSADMGFKIVGQIILWIAPDLERFNWRAAPVYQESIPANEILSATGYAAGWIIVLIVGTSLIFQKRDFV